MKLVHKMAITLGALVSATRTMAGGDLSRPIGLKTGDEFGEIANAFEEMRRGLRQKEQKLEQFVLIYLIQNALSLELGHGDLADYP